MDTLSRLLSLYPMRGSLDVRCHFRAPWIIDHPAAAPGVVPYHLVLSGTAWLDVSDETATPLNMGDVALFPRGRAHRLYTGAPADASPSRVVPSVSSLMQRVNDGDGPVTDVLCGEFAPLSGAPNAMVAALPDTVVIRGDAHASGIADLRALIDMLRKETETPRPGSDTVVSQLASVLFALLIRAWLEQAPAESGLYALLGERRLQPALHGMLAAPEKDWSLEDMARECNMSRATLARLFQQVSGTTPAVLLLQTRMAHASAMLKRGGVSVAAVGEAVGYQSEAAFHRVFKRHFGIGPGKYRQGIAAPIS
ncbi:MAG: AraC family transcriptional regulator [Achromobacter mucicolens]|uniref:AraC family transcriptional regulator n=1 Tax=Achromobacter mucicolens TaxID=1389922 RepID=UPI003D0D5EFF